MGLLSCLGLAPSSEVRVQRYKLLIPNIYPGKKQVPLGLTEPVPKTIDRRIGKLVDYVEVNPQRIPKVCQTLERNLERDAASPKLQGNVKITVEAYRQLMAASPASAVLYVPSVVRLVIILSKSAAPALQEQGIQLIAHFIQAQKAAGSWEQAFLPMLIKSSLASTQASNPALVAVRSALELAASLGQAPQDLEILVPPLLTFGLGLKGTETDRQLATDCLSLLGSTCRSASAARRLLEACLAFYDASRAWSMGDAPAALLRTVRAALVEHGLSHLGCHALVRHVARGQCPPGDLAPLLDLAVAEGRTLGPMASTSALIQCLRYFPDRMAQQTAAKTGGAAQQPAAAAAAGAAGADGSQQGGDAPSDPAAAALLSAVATFASMVGNAEDLVIAISSALEQISSPLPPADAPKAERLLDCLLATSKALAPLLRGRGKSAAQSPGAAGASSQALPPPASIRGPIQKLAGLAAGGAGPGSGRVAALSLELLVALLPVAGESGLKAPQVALLLSAAWARAIAAADARDEPALSGAEGVVTELIRTARGLEGTATVLQFVRSLYRLAAEEGSAVPQATAAPGGAATFLSLGARIRLLEVCGRLGVEVGQYQGAAAQFSRFHFKSNKFMPDTETWAAIKATVDLASMDKALKAALAAASSRAAGPTSPHTGPAAHANGSDAPSPSAQSPLNPRALFGAPSARSLVIMNAASVSGGAGQPLSLEAATAKMLEPYAPTALPFMLAEQAVRSVSARESVAPEAASRGVQLPLTPMKQADRVYYNALSASNPAAIGTSAGHVNPMGPHTPLPHQQNGRTPHGHGPVVATPIFTGDGALSEPEEGTPLTPAGLRYDSADSDLDSNFGTPRSNLTAANSVAGSTTATPKGTLKGVPPGTTGPQLAALLQQQYGNGS